MLATTCSRCGLPLFRKGEEVYCSRCGRVEIRKEGEEKEEKEEAKEETTAIGGNTLEYKEKELLERLKSEKDLRSINEILDALHKIKSLKSD